MDVIIRIIRKIMFPLWIIIAIFMGIIAAVLSAVIEFDVIRNCFSYSFGNDFFYFPLLVVLTFEIMKVSIHFCKNAFFKSDNKDIDGKMKKFFNIIKFGLVGFSLVCSFVFTANALYEEVPERKEEFITSEMESIEEKYIEEYNQYEATVEKNFNINMSAAMEKRDVAFSEYDSINIVYTPQVEYARTSAEKRAAYERYIEALDEYEELLKSEMKKKESLLLEKEEEVRINYAADVKIIYSEVHSTSEFDNPYIRTFLVSVSNIFGKDNYSRIVYLLIIGGISIFISVILEAIISISFSIMTLSPQTLLESVKIPDYTTNDGKSEDERILRMIINIFISFAIFFIYGAIMEFSFRGTHLLIAMVCFAFVALVSKKFPVKKDSPSKIKNLANEIYIHIIEGVVGFAGYILLGIVFGGTVQELTPAAIGITVGSSIGGVVGSKVYGSTKI